MKSESFKKNNALLITQMTEEDYTVESPPLPRTRGRGMARGGGTLGTLFPVGILQAWTSYQQGLWLARDASFFERGIVRFLGTVRIIPDLTIILVGVIPLAYFFFKRPIHTSNQGV